MITSAANQQVKNLIQLQKKSKERRQQKRYIIEGVRMFREAPEQMVRQIYVSASFAETAQAGELLAGKSYEMLSDAVFAKVSGTQTPQGILCVMQMPEHSLDGLFKQTQSPDEGRPFGAEPQKEPGVWLVLENIQDPGNLGTMFRTGEGAGISGIIMDRNTADIFNPKTVRSTMGSIFRVPFAIVDSPAEAVARLKARGACVYAAHLAGSVCYDEPDYTGESAFLIGNEGNGLTEETAALADRFLRIPMGGRLESLNAAMAAGILMYEANRQRRRRNVSFMGERVSK